MRRSAAWSIRIGVRDNDAFSDERIGDNSSSDGGTERETWEIGDDVSRIAGERLICKLDLCTFKPLKNQSNKKCKKYMMR